ncbi:MucB/RseB C-terminal domain-containing protein [Salinicola halophyticus]|uniref:MucB/RseB C-terminal domain-containing protein n=1 Tax=Salinicola halophyticus TaxID=1808881 RepID=UPI003F4601D9
MFRISPRAPWAAVFAVVAASAAIPASSLADDRTGQETFDCGNLGAGSDSDVSPDALFQRSLWASHCYNFGARAVRISFDGVRTLALTHSVEDGVETESARFLDGPPIAVEKRGSVGQGSKKSALGFSAGVAPAELTRQIVGHYELQPMALERIAGRPAWRLDVEPQDGLRYGYRLWLDRETALPLKREMIGIDGQILETFQITDLQKPKLYAGTLRLGPGLQPADSPWHAQWLPAGFTAQPIPPESPDQSARVEHRLYSDGLTSISLFVEPMANDRRALLAGIHRLGISYGAVRHVIHQGRPMQILVLGEAPAEVLARIASSVAWNDEDGASDTVADSVDDSSADSSAGGS